MRDVILPCKLPVPTLSERMLTGFVLAPIDAFPFTSASDACRLAEELSTELGAMTERLLRKKEGAGAAAGPDQRQGGAPEEVEG